MTVLGGCAVSREVLGRRGDPPRLLTLDERPHVPGDEAWIRAERPHPNDGVLRIDVEIGHRREVHVDPASAQPGAERRGHLTGQHRIVDGAERGASGQVRTSARIQSGDVAAFLVDGDEQVCAISAQPGRERRHAPVAAAAVDVPAEEDHPAEALDDEGA